MDVPIAVGTRVSVEGFYATIRFFGSVKGTQANWIGVEWDDPSRGKHNGCYKGAQYFKTRHPTSGSFIRPAKADLGMSVREAIKQKYLQHVTDEKHRKGDSEAEDVWLIGDLGSTQSNRKVIEFVGPEKVSELQSRQELLRIVNLHNMPVSSAGREIHSVAPFIMELDVSHTLLADWDSVALIAQQLPQLRELKLGQNCLKVPSLVSKHQEAFESVKRISLQACALNWDNVLHLAPMWPHIKALEVSMNQISTITTPPKTIFYNLESLSLQSNPIASWSEIVKLSALPKLRELYLNQCQIPELSFPCQTGQKTEQFPLLERLEIADNLLSSWRSIAELEKLAALRALRVNGNPVTQGKFEEVFYEIIGRLSIANINRMEVCRDTRKEAELYYLKKNFPEHQLSRESDNRRTEFGECHPRFKELLEKYGEPVIAVVDTGPATLQKSLLALTFVAIDEPTLQPIEKKIPERMTVGNLKRSVNAMFKKIGKRPPALTYLATDGRYGDYGSELDFGNDMRDLYYYGIQNGDKILARW